MWMNFEISVGLLTRIKSPDNDTCLLQIIPQGTAQIRLVVGVWYLGFLSTCLELLTPMLLFSLLKLI